MKVVLAPDSFKGSASALEVCRAMARGVSSACESAEIVFAPMADGGEGTVETLVQAYNGRTETVTVTGPAGLPVNAKYGIILKNLCVIEMAESSGITLVPKAALNPMTATTYGLGQLILDALDKGCKTFVIGLGGSATNDGGAGMAQALGYELLDDGGNEIGQGGGALDRLSSIRTDGVDKRLAGADFRIACDVKNPLCGPDGASRIFGPQKGATEKDVEILDGNLKHFAEIIKRDLGKDVSDVPGAGAAGGLGAGAMAFLGGNLHEGFSIISGLLNLESRIQDADLVITGEGKCDSQTLGGKTPFGVVSLAYKHKVPSLIIAGEVSEGLEPLRDMGVEIVGIKTKDMSTDYAMKHVLELIECVEMTSYFPASNPF